ncbi:MAG: helix-turn-helix domain-containing protein [Rhodomicrobium sp.]
MSKTKTIKASDIHAKDYAGDDAYRKAYDDLEEEYALIRTLIEARMRAHLSQAQLAERMNTTQTAIARLESGNTMPSTRTLRRIAKATGHKLRIILEPEGSPASTKTPSTLNPRA